MKATGIVRRIDDLGRVVIPKEIRRTLRIREGDPLEIFVDRDGEVILKKYSPISELGDFAKEYAEALYESLRHPVLVADRDTYIAVSGGSKKDYANKSIGEVVEEAINQRQSKVESTKGEYNIVSDHKEMMRGFAVAPIIANGDPIGAVVMVAKEDKVDEVISGKLLETAAGFLARQMEQ
ncbi:stage V sporulation protein T [Alteribacillus sp. HJP-4]|uniref:stage V sporulation protein T n=1 Tax=Alteribacillus sp. HJP-4 TaxID=2775394 RepID=UPI0035CD32E9